MKGRHGYSRSLVLALLLGGLPWLAACDKLQSTATSAATDKATTTVREKLKHVSVEVEEKLATESFPLDGIDENAPEAEITPQGDLVVDGNTIEIDAGQRALLLDYRARLGSIAQDGVAIGMQGAELAMKAMGAAFASGVDGGSAETENSFEAEAEKLKAQAMKICDRLPGLLATQDALADSLAEFRPYASMTQADIDECREDSTSE